MGGNLVAQVLLAIIIGLCLKAFGYSATLAELILVNTFVSLFAGFMPVPGGVGVAEAAYTAGLIAIGIPESAATSTALMVRLITFYIPPIWGRSRCAGCVNNGTCSPACPGPANLQAPGRRPVPIAAQRFLRYQRAALLSTGQPSMTPTVS